MRHQEILFAVPGQSFYIDVLEGRPSAPSVQVFSWATDDDGATEAATTGACTVDTVNTQLAADVFETGSTLDLVSGAGITRGRRYLLTSTTGDSELVEVVAIVGTRAALRRPLANEYAAGSTLQGIRISVAVSPTWVADKNKISDLLDEGWRTAVLANREREPGGAGYRLRWIYTVNGDTTVGVSYADLVRYSARNLCSALDVDNRIPGFVDRLPPDHRQDQGAALLEEAHHAVRFDALADAQVLRRIRNTEVLVDLVAYRANLMAVQAQVMAGRANLEALDVARDLYRQRYDQLLREPKVPVDNGGGGASGPAQRLPVWRR